MGHRVLLRGRARGLDLARQPLGDVVGPVVALQQQEAQHRDRAGSARSRCRRRRGRPRAACRPSARTPREPQLRHLAARAAGARARARRGSPRTRRASRAGRSATRRRAGSARAPPRGSGTRSWKTRSWRLSGRSRICSSRSAPSLVRTSMTLALMSLSPSARATETRWWPSWTKCRSPIRKTSIGGIASPRLRASAIRSQRPRVFGRGAEGAVEVAAAAVDGADDRVERDHLLAERVPAGRAERGDDLLERQHVRDVVGLEAHARGQPRAGRAGAAPCRRRSSRLLGAGRCSRLPSRRYSLERDPVAVGSRSSRRRARRSRPATARRRCAGRASPRGRPPRGGRSARPRPSAPGR